MKRPFNCADELGFTKELLSCGLRLEPLAERLLMRLRESFAFEAMAVHFFTEGGKPFRSFSFTVDPERLEKITRCSPEYRSPAEIPDEAEIRPWQNRLPEPANGGSSLIFPLKLGEVPRGVLTLFHPEPDCFCEPHVRFLDEVSRAWLPFAGNALLYEETRKRLDEAALLYEIAAIPNSSLDQMLTETAERLKDLFGFESVQIFLMDESSRTLLPHGVPSAGKDASAVGEDEIWAVRRSIEEGEDLLIPHLCRFAEGSSEILSEICVPLTSGERTIGVIDARSGKSKAFLEEDIRRLKAVAQHIAGLVENARFEETYRAVVESALDGVMVLNGECRFTYANERMADILGASKEELMESDFRDYLEEESKERILDGGRKRLRKEDLPSRFEISLHRKTGEVRNVEVSSTVVRDSQGAESAIAFVKDITEKRKMEEQLLQAEKLRAVGEMASGVAHDFNNALAVILGNAQLLLFNAEEGEIKEVLRTIEKVAKGSALTVRRLLEFTRKGGGGHLFKLDVNHLIRDAVEMTRPKWKDEVQKRGACIDVVLHLGDIPCIAGIASDLRDTVTNMIFNAIDAMPNGGTIAIRSLMREHHVLIRISDTGIGMTEEVRKRIFEPFFTTKAFSNTGLGLSMAYGIVKRLGGEIDVESHLGKGTTFTLALPIGLEGKQEEAAPFPKMNSGKEARVLVIDDEEFVRNVLSRIFQKANHHVTLAANGEEGIRLFKENAFDLVVTDLGMPGLSGWDVCKAIKEIAPDAPVGMITGWGMEVDEQKMKQNGLDFVISKPFDFSSVINAAADAIDARRMGGLSI
jgi:PAS domain S-box-containing protein